MTTAILRRRSKNFLNLGCNLLFLLFPFMHAQCDMKTARWRQFAEQQSKMGFLFSCPWVVSCTQFSPAP
jgi:hypothetical protein